MRGLCMSDTFVWRLGVTCLTCLTCLPVTHPPRCVQLSM